MAERKSRTVKPHSKYRSSAATGWVGDNVGKNVPWLNVSGVWLRQVGFNVGDAVEITIENKMLTIKNIAADGDTGN